MGDRDNLSLCIRVVVDDVDVGFRHSDGIENPRLSFGVDPVVAVGYPFIAPGLLVVMLVGGGWGYSGERPVTFVIGQM